MLGYGKTTGGFVPPEFDFALKVEPPPLDPKRAKQLLAEAGYSNGFDAGDLTPLPPYTSVAEAIGGYFPACRIHRPRRTLASAALPTSLGGQNPYRLLIRPAARSRNPAPPL